MNEAGSQTGNEGLKREPAFPLRSLEFSVWSEVPAIGIDNYYEECREGSQNTQAGSPRPA